MAWVPALLAITPGDGRDLVPWIAALAGAGLPGLLVREPGLSPAGLAMALAAAHAVPFVAVHERTLAGLSPPDGLTVHRASGSASDSVSSRTGVSCHSADEVDAALGAGALYTLLSPVWSPISKPRDRRPCLGLEGFLGVARGRSVLALGGLNPERFARLQRAGASGAVLGDLFGRADPAAAARRLLAYGVG